MYPNFLQGLENDITKPFIENSILLDNSNNRKEKTTLVVQEFIYKKHNDKEEVIAIIYNFYKKEYRLKIFIRLLMDHINKKYKYNIFVKQQTQLSSIQKLYNKMNTRRVKDYIKVTIDFIVGF